ncbi:MAG: hypothetical protein ABUS79_05770, partial [Pseudomonadota bacterium]
MVIGVIAFTWGARARAEESSVIRAARAPIAYGFELEPHLVLGGNPPGPGGGSGVGLGGRLSVPVAPQGFIANLNDSVALGFGLDVSQYSSSWGGDGRDECVRFAPGPNGTSICTEVSGGNHSYVFVPVVMQWNFWLT